MRIKKELYPGTVEAEAEKMKGSRYEEPEKEPDYIAGKPNYEKFHGLPVERILQLYNID